jgi:hypothetical protein
VTRRQRGGELAGRTVCARVRPGVCPTAQPLRSHVGERGGGAGGETARKGVGPPQATR